MSDKEIKKDTKTEKEGAEDVTFKIRSK